MPKPEENKTPNLLTVNEVRKRLSVGRDAVMGWIQRGELRATNLSTGSERSRWRIPESDLDEFIQDRFNRKRSISKSVPQIIGGVVIKKFV